MKGKNISTGDSVLRVVLGSMLFMLFWFHTLGNINISDSKNVVLGIFMLSAYLLITGSARISPIYYLIKKMIKK